MGKKFARSKGSFTLHLLHTRGMYEHNIHPEVLSGRVKLCGLNSGIGWERCVIGGGDKGHADK